MTKKANHTRYWDWPYKNEFNNDPSTDNTAQLEMVALDSKKQMEDFIAAITSTLLMLTKPE